MTTLFLKAKHWQLFILMFGIPLMFQIAMMSMMFSNIALNGQPDPNIIFDMLQYFPFMMLFYMGLLFGWFWSLAIGLQTMVPESIHMQTKKFQIFFFIPLLYITLFMFFMMNMFSDVGLNGIVPSGDMIGVMIGLIIPLHLLSMFSIFYCIYFCAKTFKTVTLQREVSFGDFAGEFFMLWFWPIGIWMIQPKLNALADRNAVE